jgi:CheY-like chemotaxis protein
LNRKKILIVDDQRGVRELLKAILNDFSLQEASDGLEAITIIQQWSPDLIIIDMKMPVLDGGATIKKMATLNLKTKPKVLLMTAATEINDAKIADLNVDQWINKPFDLEELREKVILLLEKHGD